MALFVVLQTYGDRDAVARLHAEHVAWIETHAAAGTFLLAGQTVPPGGSVILAQAASADDVEGLLHGDALTRDGLVTEQRVIEFAPRRGALRASAANPLHLVSNI